MLSRLSIANIVLIKQLVLECQEGLTVLSGETGAGKSILLNALGLILGKRGDAALVRAGEQYAIVAAEFSLPRDHSVCHALREHGILCDDGEVIIRRRLSRDGASKIWVNDQAVTLKFLRSIAGQLIVIHGQHGQKSLLEASFHTALLDAYGGLTDLAGQVRVAYHTWRDAKDALQQLRDELSQSARERDYLMHILKELDALDPQVGEETTLSDQRMQLMHAEKHGKLLRSLDEQLNGAMPVASVLSQVQQIMIRNDMQTSDAGKDAIEALERALQELADAEEAIAVLQRADTYDERALEVSEERLFALREQARKHRVSVDDLADIYHDAKQKVNKLEHSEQVCETLDVDVQRTCEAYVLLAQSLREARQKVVPALQDAMHQELAPLKMEATRFEVRCEPLEQASWHAGGMDAISFEVSTNPGSPFGALSAIASGGELSRFMLAMAVVMGNTGMRPSMMVFDEIDTGTGGAVADAIGARLAALSRHHQVSVVTHLPQVAARGDMHYFIEKTTKGDATHTTVSALDDTARHEEIARMLSGARITPEAREAAKQLLSGKAVAHAA